MAKKVTKKATPKGPTPTQKLKAAQTENADLQRQLDDARKELAAARDAQIDDQLATLETPPAESEPLPDPEVYRDPFAGQNPHEIMSDPPGYKLGWKSEKYREHRGMRGWEPVMYDDPIGQNLDQYLNDPPHRMKHQTDMIVRRGDVMLCRLPEEMWFARQQQRVDKAHRYETDHADDLQPDKNHGRSSIVSDTSRSMLR